MRRWGVVPIVRVHRLHGPLGTHSRLRVGHRPRNLRGQSDGDLGNLWEANIKVCHIHTVLFR